MAVKNLKKAIFPAVLCSVSLILLATIPCLSIALQEYATATAGPGIVDLGNINGTTVTLYYYDEATGGKGNIVPIPDNPQVVVSDPNIAAPGSYTFTRVPAGKYYIEANNSGNKYFAIVEVTSGTSTANIAIPTWKKVNESAVPRATPVVSPTEFPTNVTSNVSTNDAQATTPATCMSPGMTVYAALISILSTVLILAKKYGQ